MYVLTNIVPKMLVQSRKMINFANPPLLRAHTTPQTMKRPITILAAALAAAAAYAAAPYQVTSPDGTLTATLQPGDSLTLTVSRSGVELLAPSTIGLTLTDGTEVGPGKLSRVATRKVNHMTASPFYRADSLREAYNELTLKVGRDWQLLLRAYDDGAAYRWVRRSAKPADIAAETVRYRLPAQTPVVAPYVNCGEPDSFEKQFRNSFENYYQTTTLDGLDSRRLMFLPMVAEPVAGTKILLTESALEAYPGMYLNRSADGLLEGVFAPVPKDRRQGGHNNLQMLVQEREPYIARLDGARALPWRIVGVAPDDVTLASTNISYLLGEPCRLDDLSWIRPGKVAWDWWNDWNITGVDFVSGVNNDTYKAYIDFASRRGIEYVILDEGWAVNRQADLMQVVPEINLPELVEYANGKGVGLILWAGYHAFDRDMEEVCRHYADMGIKGFKVDFMDHDDQIITDFNYRAAETCARHKLLLDLHGTSKPAGLNRTWPNVVNFEGVCGLEQMKWASPQTDQVTYDVQIPFIRQASGPMDYTQGAMRNATRRDYRPVNDDPMSQGTRCRQLAMYAVYDSPLNMMCDTPSNYDAEDECAAFIAAVPTVWDETRILAGEIGKYIVTARRKGDVWYIGGMTDWTARTLPLDLSFIAPEVTGTLMRDGVNAHRNAVDYRSVPVTSTNLEIPMAPGGGFLMRVQPVK